MKTYQRHPELVGAFLFTVSILLAICCAGFNGNSAKDNPLGLFGYAIAFVTYLSFGFSCWSILLTSCWLGIRLALSIPYTAKRIAAIIVNNLLFGLFLTLLGSSIPSLEKSLQHYLGLSFSVPLGGFPLFFLYKMPYIGFETVLGAAGTLVITSFALMLSTFYLFEQQILACIGNLYEDFLAWMKKPPKKKEEPKQPLVVNTHKPLDIDNAPVSARVPSLLSTYDALDTEGPFPEPILSFYEEPERVKKTASPKKEVKKASGEKIAYELPSIDLLNSPKKVDTSSLVKELKAKAELLEETLLSFGIEGKVIEIHSGPSITSFEVQPAVGVKVGKIKTLEHDIALNLEAKSIRIIAPIPGKACVGIEVPNKNPQMVTFKELFSAYQNDQQKFKIPLLLGKAVNGDLVLCDLTKMPHAIIAGATGSGKSVSIHSIIISILMTQTPDDVRLLMIDPKKVELTPYSNLPHMITPVICDPREAFSALQWLVAEMEKRYEYLRLTGQRNIEGYNNRGTKEEALPDKLPYIVGIVDELADLMMVSGQDIETPIARIAQMARAVGIHLILATQRPSREVITGLIKANFPARLAFKVASRVNSQIILDETGAETLLGNGDMLLLMPGSAQLLRNQGAFVHDEEIRKIIEAIESHWGPNYMISSFTDMNAAEYSGKADESEDELFDEAKSTILSTGNASTTFLQRKLKIGYARAASLMDELERKGIVGPQEGAKPRKIFYAKEV